MSCRLATRFGVHNISLLSIHLERLVCKVLFITISRTDGCNNIKIIMFSINIILTFIITIHIWVNSIILNLSSNLKVGGVFIAKIIYFLGAWLAAGCRGFCTNRRENCRYKDSVKQSDNNRVFPFKRNLSLILVKRKTKRLSPIFSPIWASLGGKREDLSFILFFSSADKQTRLRTGTIFTDSTVMHDILAA